MTELKRNAKADMPIRVSLDRAMGVAENGGRKVNFSASWVLQEVSLILSGRKDLKNRRLKDIARLVLYGKTEERNASAFRQGWKPSEMLMKAIDPGFA